MPLVRRLPYRTHFGIEQQLRDMQRLMNALSGPPTQSSSEDDGGANNSRAGGRVASAGPAVDVYREDDELVMEFELPGVDVENDVDVEINDGVLTVRGQSSSERSDDRGGVYLRERRSGSFSRSLTLPDGVESDDIEADYADGVLCIRVPMPEDEDQQRGPRRISVTTGRSRSKNKAVTSGADEQEVSNDQRSDSKASGAQPNSTAETKANSDEAGGDKANGDEAGGQQGSAGTTG